MASPAEREPIEIVHPDIPVLENIRIGDYITGIASGRDLDKFEVMIGGMAAYDERMHRWVPKTPLSTEMRPPKFFGELRNIAALVDEKLWHGIGFTVVASLYSTGRGELGSVARKVSYRPGGDQFSHLVYRKLGQRTGILKSDEIGSKLLSEASENNRQATEFALRHILPGGLPGLGKR